MRRSSIKLKLTIEQQERNRLWVRWWLYGLCVLVFAIVIIGGATRLTDSGLSITEWQPILGAIPPLNDWDWLDAFDKYQQIPEYQQINRDMSLQEFKFIYWWEWGHRFVGRAIGLYVLLPLIFFWVSSRLENFLKPRLIILFLLGGLQGTVGWWMVKSGLVDRVDVSQYRLAIHLSLAGVIFSWAVWIARGLATHNVPSGPMKLRKIALVTTALILAQIFLGALVAGLDAGLAYNDWPLMDGALVPGGLFTQHPAWINLFENPKTVQFVHRIGAYLVVLMVLYQLAQTSRLSNAPTHILRSIILTLLIFMQLMVGVVTLVMQVPLSWALVHQGMAFIVLGFSVAHLRALKGSYPPQTGVLPA